MSFHTVSWKKKLWVFWNGEYSNAKKGKKGVQLIYVQGDWRVWGGHAVPLFDLAQLYQPLHIVEDPAQIPCRGHAARSGFKIVIISITNINMIPVPRSWFFFIRISTTSRWEAAFVLSTHFVQTPLWQGACCLYFLYNCISENIMMMVISNLRNCPMYHNSERENQVDGDDDDEEGEGDKLS